MPTLRFTAVGLEVEVPADTNLLDAAHQAGAPVGTHCGGVCACSKCHVYASAPDGVLSPAAQDEQDMLELAAREPRDTSRLACQTRIIGDGVCEVAISEESFEAYLDDHEQDRARMVARWRSR
jgi:ferredoxin, 2Fe-2S